MNVIIIIMITIIIIITIPIITVMRFECVFQIFPLNIRRCSL